MGGNNWWELAEFGTYHHTDAEGSIKTRQRVARLFIQAFDYLDEIEFIPSRVLDAGCGLGFVSALLCRRFPSANVLAVDNFGSESLTGSSIRLAEENMRSLGCHKQVTFLSHELVPLPFGDSVFDTVVTSLVYHNLGDSVRDGIEELKRVLMPGGIMLFGDLMFKGSFDSYLEPLKVRREYRVEGRYLKDYRLLVVS